jgi:hypothetical protein
MADSPPVVEAPPVAPALAAPEFGDAFAAIDALGRDDGTPAPPEQPPPGDGRAHGRDGRFLPETGDKPPDKPVEKPNGKVPEAPKPDGDVDVDKLPTRELAKHYHKLKAEQKEWLKKQEDYEKKLKAPAEWPEKKTYEEKLAEREKKIEEYNKRVADYEQELQFTNFTKSQAYKDQYEKPLTQAYKAGQAETATLEIVERKDDAENIIQPRRDATTADFDKVMSVSNNRDAVKLAVQLFGEAAPVVLAHRKAVFEKNALAEEAIKEYQSKGAEREKVLREQSEKASKEYSGMVENFQKAAAEKYPNLFKPDESDPEGNALLDQGNHLLQRVLKNGAPLKDGEKQMTGEEYAIAVAAVRNKAGGFDRVNRRRHIAEKRVKELEKELEQYKSSRPGNGDGNGRGGPVEDDDPLAKLDKMGKNV